VLDLVDLPEIGQSLTPSWGGLNPAAADAGN
jgi:4-hydroxy-3-polyprenylbenzoate decarboxylase